MGQEQAAPDPRCDLRGPLLRRFPLVAGAYSASRSAPSRMSMDALPLNASGANRK